MSIRAPPLDPDGEGVGVVATAVSSTGAEYDSSATGACMSNWIIASTSADSTCIGAWSTVATAAGRCGRLVGRLAVAGFACGRLVAFAEPPPDRAATIRATSSSAASLRAPRVAPTLRVPPGTATSSGSISARALIASSMVSASPRVALGRNGWPFCSA